MAIKARQTIIEKHFMLKQNFVPDCVSQGDNGSSVIMQKFKGYSTNFTQHFSVK